MLYANPNELCGAELVLASYPLELCGLPVAWQLSARRHAAPAMTAWSAHFTAGIPSEALVGLCVANSAVQGLTSALRGSRRPSRR
ncbi:DUF317 domain-containing protein [Streptomyces sp. NPDC058545]|uniref:DUF317 domain-containing protein n=1 Tax=Streptomyces sp. NPDC058545 TaxID=3346544 RepID=UPI0036521870